MKNILFLIGNGFDINLGLKTKFSDVKSEYLNLDSNDPIINEFKETLEQDHEDWSDFESAMGKYTEKFNSSNKDKYVSQIKSFRDVLIEKFEKEEARIDYNANKDRICKVFVASLFGFDKYLSQKSKNAISSITALSPDNKDFSYNFITFNYTNVLDECIKIIKEKRGFSRSFLSKNGQHGVNDMAGNILHIHGTLQENLILGVDNPSQIINEELSKDVEFQWETVKPKMNEELEENYDVHAKTMIDDSSIICIFGISIGKTDETWWKHIFNWLKSDATKHLILFYYKGEASEKDTGRNIQHKYRIKKLFFDVVGSTDEQERKEIGERIHIAKKNGEMFKMDILSSDKKLSYIEVLHDPIPRQ